MDDPVHPWQEPARGGAFPLELFGLSGRAANEAFLQMGGPAPPVAHLTGITFTGIDDEHVTFTLPASEWFLSSQEHISAGALMILADSALGAAVYAAMPPATPVTTWDLSLTFLRPCPAGGVLTGTGRLIRDDRPLALSEMRLTDDKGDLVAHGTSSCYVLPPIPGIAPPASLPSYEPPVYSTPDPCDRPAMGQVIPWDVWRTMSGIEILTRQIAGELPQPPIHYLTGMTLRDATAGRATFILPASPWLANPMGFVQGGALGMLGHAAAVTAIASTLDAQSAYRPVDVKVHFLRPGIADGRELTARGEVTHRGKTLAVARGDVVDADGKMIATAVASAMIQSEREEG